MSNFLAYVRNDKGGAVEYVMLIAVIGGIIVAVGSSTTLKTAVNTMFETVFSNASKKATM